MMMYSLHSTPFPLSLPLSADNGRTTDVITWMVLTAVRSVSYWASQWKKYHPITITQCQYRSNPSFLQPTCNTVVQPLHHPQMGYISPSPFVSRLSDLTSCSLLHSTEDLVITFVISATLKILKTMAAATMMAMICRVGNVRLNMIRFHPVKCLTWDHAAAGITTITTTYHHNYHQSYFY